MNWAQFKDPVSHVSGWHCGSILVSYTRGGWVAVSSPFTVMTNIYRSQQSCGQGNIFTPVCHSVHRGGGVVCLSACWDTTPPPPGSRHPSGADPPRADTPGTRNPPE